MRTFIAISIMSVLGLTLKGQDPVFTQYNTSSPYLNPANAGVTHGMSVAYQYRIQWPSISGNFQTNTGNYQTSFSKRLSGLAVLSTNDLAGDVLTTNNFGLALSKHFKLGKIFKLGLGLQADYRQRSIDWSRLTFGDQIDAKLGFTPDSTSTVLPKNTIVNVNLHAGAFVHLFNLELGFAVNNFNQPDESFYANFSSELPIRYTYYGSYDLTIKKSKKFIISPSVIHIKQADFTQTNIGVTTRYRFLRAHVGFRAGDAVIYGFGFVFKRFVINYSYDQTISLLSNITGGAHEGAIIFRFGGKGDYSGQRNSF